MKKSKDVTPPMDIPNYKPALSPEAEEAEMISLATNLARQQLLNGTASSQVITHYLKLGSSKEQLEKETMQKELELLQAKIEALQSGQRAESLYSEAIEYFKIYSGHKNDD